MATAMDRAAIGAEEARMEGKGVGGQAAEGLRNVATGRDNGLRGTGPLNMNSTNTTVGDRGLFGGHHNHGNTLGHTEEEMAHLRTKTHITGEGDAYCPNPNVRDLPKEFETRVQVIQRYPEMKTVEKTDFVKEVHHEERTIIVPRTRVIHEDVERIDRVPVVRQIPKTRIEVHHRVVADEREVVDMVPEVDYVDVPRVEMVPRVITEDVEEVVVVPTVREVPVTRMVEVPTGNWCEAPAGAFVTPGDFNLLSHGGSHGLGHHNEHHGLGHHNDHRTTTTPVGAGGVGPAGGLAGAAGLVHRRTSSSSSSSSSSDDERVHGNGVGTGYANPDGTTVDGTGRRKKKSLLRRVLHQ